MSYLNPRSLLRVGVAVLVGFGAPVLATMEPLAESSAVAASATAARCSTSHLKATFHGASGAAGTDYADIILTNTGHTSCTLRGVPSGRFLANKTATGAPSTSAPYSPNSRPARTATVTLKARTGYAVIRTSIVVAANYGASCRAVQADAIALRLPHTSKPFNVPLNSTHDNRIQVCQSTRDHQLDLSQLLAKRTVHR